MNIKGMTRAHVCLTATTTALLAGSACGHAFASQTHTLKHGETVEFLGRHYHLAVKDILSANHLDANDILLDGRSLYIPDAPQPTIVPSTMLKEARVKGDRISIRIGPASSRHRLRLCDNGTKLVVTAEKDDWLQVRLADGHTGWVRSDFVHFSGVAPPSNIARSSKMPGRGHFTPMGHLASAAAEGRDRVHSAVVAETRGAEPRKHNERHALKEAAARIRERHQQVAGARLRRHDESAAQARHERHLMEAAAARRHSHLAVIAARHHASEVAAARRHHKHIAELAAARHHKHLVEIADARRHKRLAEIAAAGRHESHSPAAQALHKKRLGQIAEARHHSHLKEIAESRHKHRENEVAHARRQKHLDEIAAARHHHHLEALANAKRRHLAAAAAHEHRAQIASARHQENVRYSHKIRPEAESPSTSNDVVRSAFAYRGTPYRWGSSRPGGFDCSGFTKYIYGRKGVALPRTAAEQYHAGKLVAHSGMKPGDLVFFHTTRSGISHVGMYVGNGKFVHSSSQRSGGVRVDNLDSGYYNKAFRGARRVRKETNEASGE